MGKYKSIILLRGVPMETKRQNLVEGIIQYISDGRIPRGGKMPTERDLAVKFNVSRNLLREALITLECLGYIEIRGREGIFIRQADLADLDSGMKNIAIWPEEMMQQLMEMRLLTEVPAAGLAAKRRSSEQMEKMHECLANLKRIHLEGERLEGEGAHWDSLLHTLIVESASNTLLSRVYEGLSAVMEKYIGNSRRSLFAMKNWPEKILEQHQQLISAIEDQDEEQASTLARDHINEAMKQLRVFQ